VYKKPALSYPSQYFSLNWLWMDFSLFTPKGMPEYYTTRALQMAKDADKT